MINKMACNRCETIPKLNVKCNLVYTYIPTHHHEPFLERFLRENKYTFEQYESYLLVEVSNFEAYVGELTSIFNTLEQKDVKLLPISENKGLTFESLVNQKSLAEWKAYLIDAKDVVYVISEKQFKVFYQPIRDAKTLEIYGYEALIRGINQSGDIISPVRLFTQAKSMDLVFQLDKAARETIIDVTAKMGLSKQLFINFLPTSIYQPELCLKTTKEAIRRNGIRPDKVTFEVVETERIKDYVHLKQILDYYKKQGYKTALDDVGSGYNNQEVIKQLMPNLIKIDRTITMNIHENPKNQLLLKNYIQLAKSLNIKILIEGIETKEEVDYLCTLDIDYVQGYYFGKPAESFVE
ncbi:MAG: EAL domain-containing protein [Bacillota bacterium]